ncbi:putative leucine-rich repeat receptor-like protein kinase [Iris pallida]|uniref:Leucine-rich repeat receptor-like protein kinase n=1 Tax=Iris pallida TaxID=29817 RepID=A0AAX6FN61_IRIPA|nr:putative leucine-rich repeat receptor-like protein kinase [Iris pallida]
MCGRSASAAPAWPCRGVDWAVVVAYVWALRRRLGRCGQWRRGGPRAAPAPRRSVGGGGAAHAGEASRIRAGGRSGGARRRVRPAKSGATPALGDGCAGNSTSGGRDVRERERRQIWAPVGSAGPTAAVVAGPRWRLH